MTSSTLTLLNFQVTSAGVYTCLVQNRIGVDRKIVKLNVNGNMQIINFYCGINKHFFDKNNLWKCVDFNFLIKKFDTADSV